MAREWTGEKRHGLLHLVQHHGYPTPLLDWTESPFVAAYFAFNRIPKNPASEGDIRIFALDRESFTNSSYPSADHTYDFAPALSVLNLPFRDNQRAVPQQSVQTFTNTYDPEMLIDIWQEAEGCRYLTKIDIKKSGRNVIMSELERMNITASRLFPGLDGLCQTLKENYF